ncbi:MAG TPA: hypothetical protein VFG42_13825 [Baekduia sp.]|uniref:hypothetical protein n=1 Tax=Baekduia sp. TaxID=2600305 RepID=UPI002D7912AD|nr:hypothetical protein [Baekduia sp.]HET6507863.1 hypothetical protein [Baekduia sp.]
MSDRAPAQLRAGPLTAVLDGADLRWVRWDGVEVVRRLGFAARGPSWSTIPATARDVVLEERPAGFDVRVTARHAGAGLDLSWTGTIGATDSGSLIYSVTWTAHEPFAYNRIGLVVLLAPAAVTGRAYRLVGPEGTVRGRFPTAVAPQPFTAGHYAGMAPPLTALSFDLAPGEVQLAFEGERFELEDQRNWADDSFKAYGTPLSVPLPQHAEPSAPVGQAVTLRVAALPRRARRTAPARPPRLRVGGRDGTVGDLGLPVAPTAGAAGAAGAAFLRADADAAAPGWRAEVEAFLALCDAADRDGELGLLRPTAAAVGELLAAAHPRLARIVAAGATGEPTDPACCADPALAAGDRPARPALFGGTHRWFAELHRWHPAAGGFDGLGYVASPQVHDRDTPSIAENVAGLRATIRAAGALYPDRPIAVRLHLDERAPDPRLATAWGGAWLAAALAELLAGGAAHVTALHAGELAGAADAQAAFAHLAALPGLPRLQRTDPPAGVGALAYERDGGPALLLANAGARDAELTVAGPDGHERLVSVAAGSWAEHALS